MIQAGPIRQSKDGYRQEDSDRDIERVRGGGRLRDRDRETDRPRQRD